ncbi:hydrogenase maturation nickel metallochaperone HypA [Planctomycetota bacterium]
MHEMSIAVALMQQLEAVAAEHGVERIEAVTVRAGVFHQLVPEALALAFQAVAEGTRAEGATLSLEVAPALAECRQCGLRFEPELDRFLCERCGEADVELVEGNDIVLTSVTCDDPDGASSDEDQRGA